MKLNFHFFVFFFIACLALITDLIIYITQINYGIALVISFGACLIYSLIRIKNNKFQISSNFEKNDIFIYIIFVIFLIYKCMVYPDYFYDVKSYHMYLQENPFIDKINFDFFPGRLYCIFLYPLGDRMHYIFRYILGYRLGVILSYYVIIIIYYQIKLILQKISNYGISKSILAYGIFLIFIFNDHLGMYYVDIFGVIFLLQFVYTVFFTDLPLKKIILFLAFISGISVSIKLSNIFFIVILGIFALFKFRKELKSIKIKYWLLSCILFIIPFIIYLYDNVKQTGSFIFPYYNAIFKSEYFGFFNWEDSRFDSSKNLLKIVYWPIKVFLITLNYAHTDYGFITREYFLVIMYYFSYIFFFYSIIAKKEKNVLFEFSVLFVIFSIMWIYFLKGYVRYGLFIWFLCYIIFIVNICKFFENDTFKNYIKKIINKYEINYKKIFSYIYVFCVSFIILLSILFIPIIDFENMKYILKDRRCEKNTIHINGVWGAIADEKYIENSAYEVLVRDNTTPIYNLNKKVLSTSSKTLEMFDEKIKNNDIYVLFDYYGEKMEDNYYVKALESTDYKIESIEKIYTADDISYINSSGVWILAKVKYIGE